MDPKVNENGFKKICNEFNELPAEKQFEVVRYLRDKDEIRVKITDDEYDKITRFIRALNNLFDKDEITEDLSILNNNINPLFAQILSNIIVGPNLSSDSKVVVKLDSKALRNLVVTSHITGYLNNELTFDSWCKNNKNIYGLSEDDSKKIERFISTISEFIVDKSGSVNSLMNTLETEHNLSKEQINAIIPIIQENVSELKEKRMFTLLKRIDSKLDKINKQ
jgi:hypothetical protein